MQTSIHNQKQDKLQTLDTNVYNTNAKLSAWHEHNVKKFAAFKEKVTHCLKYIETDKQTRDYEN